MGAAEPRLCLAKGLALSLEIKQPAVPVGTGISDLQRPILHNCCNPTGSQPTKLGHGRELEELAPKGWSPVVWSFLVGQEEESAPVSRGLPLYE